MLYPISKTHQERLAFIKNMAGLIQEKYKKEIEAIILYGSVYRDEDDKYSDIELTVILKTNNVQKTFEGIYDGHKYQTIMISKNLVYKDIDRVDLVWPLRLGTYLDGRVIYGNESIIDDFNNQLNITIAKDFSSFLKKEFVDHIYETFCKFLNSADRDDTIRMYALADYLFWKIINFVGLINKYQFKTTLTRVQDSLKLKQNFPSFQKWGNKFIKGEPCNVSELKEIIYSLYEEMMVYFKNNRISLEDSELKY